MLPDPNTRDFTVNQAFAYQLKYVDNPRESDKVLMDLMEPALTKDIDEHVSLRLLDIGCHHGNLLKHLRRRWPRLDYHGGDVFPEIIEKLYQDPDLKGMHFDVMDIRDLSTQPKYDIIVANAVMFRFNPTEYQQAIHSVYDAIRSGGWFFAFDYFHPFEQELLVKEKSKQQTGELTFYVRPFSQVEKFFKDTGFSDIAFQPFSMPIDLDPPSDNCDIISTTLQTAQGRRLCFRGSFYQPWCHFSARKG